MGKKIIDEILEISPGLKKDKKKLNKIILVLEKLNPKVKASANFKSDLRTRLEVMQKINSPKPIKKSFVFLIPLFSLFFVMGTWLYLYKDINFIEVNVDTNNQANGHNFFLIEINVVSNGNQKNNLISEFDKLVHLEILSESINNLAADIAKRIMCETRFQKS